MAMWLTGGGSVQCVWLKELSFVIWIPAWVCDDSVTVVCGGSVTIICGVFVVVGLGMGRHLVRVGCGGLVWVVDVWLEEYWKK